MGMTIELVDKQEVMQTYKDYQPRLATNVSAFGESLLALPTIEAIPKADYEARLKAEKIAVLEELRAEFEEYEPKWAENEDHAVASCRTWEDFDDIIQQKINALKGDSND